MTCLRLRSLCVLRILVVSEKYSKVDIVVHKNKFKKKNIIRIATVQDNEN